MRIEEVASKPAPQPVNEIQSIRGANLNVQIAPTGQQSESESEEEDSVEEIHLHDQAIDKFSFEEVIKPSDLKLVT